MIVERLMEKEGDKHSAGKAAITKLVMDQSDGNKYI